MPMKERTSGFLKNDVVRKRLAKLLVLQCFRNTFLEDLHAGITPNSRCGDFSDVMVTTPDGDIPWNELSRLSDDEMKRLMIDSVNHVYELLTSMASPRFWLVLEELSKADPLPEWFDPPHTLDGLQKSEDTAHE
ncbi:MAG: hypothetical protein HY791_36620 [Deltaproteobacteria bacterium]|nr:hypothetical protein [Deltaproteobacteria bacterium]